MEKQISHAGTYEGDEPRRLGPPRNRGSQKPMLHLVGLREDGHRAHRHVCASS